MTISCAPWARVSRGRNNEEVFELISRCSGVGGCCHVLHETFQHGAGVGIRGAAAITIGSCRDGNQTGRDGNAREAGGRRSRACRGGETRCGNAGNNASRSGDAGSDYAGSTGGNRRATRNAGTGRSGATGSSSCRTTSRPTRAGAAGDARSRATRAFGCRDADAGSNARRAGKTSRRSSGDSRTCVRHSCADLCDAGAGSACGSGTGSSGNRKTAACSGTTRRAGATDETIGAVDGG